MPASFQAGKAVRKLFELAGMMVTFNTVLRGDIHSEAASPTAVFTGHIDWHNKVASPLYGCMRHEEATSI